MVKMNQNSSVRNIPEEARDDIPCVCRLDVSLRSALGELELGRRNDGVGGIGRTRYLATVFAVAQRLRC